MTFYFKRDFPRHCPFALDKCPPVSSDQASSDLAHNLSAPGVCTTRSSEDHEITIVELLEIEIRYVELGRCFMNINMLGMQMICTKTLFSVRREFLKDITGQLGGISFKGISGIYKLSEWRRQQSFFQE